MVGTVSSTPTEEIEISSMSYIGNCVIYGGAGGGGGPMCTHECVHIAYYSVLEKHTGLACTDTCTFYTWSKLTEVPASFYHEVQ